MKKTIRKALVLLAVVAMAVVMMSFASSAAASCGSGNHFLVETYYAPTCTTSGYTRYDCTVCDFYSTSAKVDPPLGHDYEGVDYVYEKEGSFYKKGIKCNRCQEIQYDSVDGAYVEYQLVELCNPWVVDTYDAEITYTKIADTYKTELLSKKGVPEYGNWYVKKGESLMSYITELGFASYDKWMAAVDNENFCERWPDKAYGLYELAGWTTEAKDADEFTADDFVDFTAPVTENSKIYAAFRGDSEVAYNVQYVNADGGYFTTIFDVRHGQKADDSIFEPLLDGNKEYILDENGVIQYQNPKLSLKEDANYYYVFKGWSIDHEHVYGPVTIKATYHAIPKQYDYAIYLWDAAANDYVKSDITANAYYGAPLAYSNLPDGKTINDVTARAKDRSYIYSWTGDWEILGRYSKVQSNATTVPNGYQDTRYRGTEGYEPIALIPTYKTALNYYRTTVTIKFDSSVKFDSATTPEYEREEYLNGLNVQITDENGQLMATGTGYLVAGTDYAQFTCALYDSSKYTVTVMSPRGKYIGSTVLSRNYVYDFNAPVYISVGLTVNQDYINGLSCKCIHHNTLFQPLWVRLLNLLYRIFKVKYVCCDDMYATIGDLLVY